MTKRRLLISLVVALLTVASCNKPDGGGQVPSPSPTPTPIPTPTPDPDPDPDPPATTPYFKADIHDLYVQGPDDTGFTLAIDTNMGETEWTVTSDASWITITKNSRDVAIVPDHIERDQTYPAPRDCRVSVKAGDVFGKTFTVVQEAWTRINSDYSLKMSPAGETLEVNVVHNCYSWTPRTEAKWLSVSKKNTATLVITSSPRGSSGSGIRSSVVRLQSDWQPDTFWDITVSDADPELGNDDYDYGDKTDWD